MLPYDHFLEHVRQLYRINYDYLVRVRVGLGRGLGRGLGLGFRSANHSAFRHSVLYIIIFL